MFTLEYLQKIFPSYQGQYQKELKINDVMTDSRAEKKHALFIPIVGDNFNGHDFIDQAIQNGAIAALWDEKEKLPSNVPASFVFFYVSDTLKAMQKLANIYRNDIDPIVIGITGSNGKTTTKDLVKSILQTEHKTHATKGNFNNHIGLPITILEMPRDTEVLVVEMGMNDFGEIDLLTKIAQPNFAIITNIGESHIEHLESREGIARAKLEIRNGLNQNGFLVIDGDEPLLKSVADEKNVITCGFAKTNVVNISDVQIGEQSTLFKINNEDYSVPLLGKHHAKNATLAIVIASRLGLDHQTIQKGLDMLEHTTMRFERIQGKNGVSIINDAYNASATSMKAAIEVVKQLEGFKHKGLVLGDILELGTYSKQMHQSVADTIEKPIDFVITFGEHAIEITKRLQHKNTAVISQHCETKKEVIDLLQNYLQEETLLLFKASRGMKFEEIIQKIME